MAQLGHQVVGVDTDAAKIALLQAGTAPFFEPEFPEILTAGVTSGRLRFTTDPKALADCQLIFVAVGTPQLPNSNAADLSYIDAAITSIANVLSDNPPVSPVVVAGKSTVPVGTAARLAEQLRPHGAILVWNPEFLQEGHAVQDTLHPDRIVYGLPPETNDAAIARTLMDDCYSNMVSVGTPQVVTDYQTAELVKVSANSFLATKISFINSMALLCETVGADVTQLATAIGFDDRIGHKFLRAGIGFGGGCLPKDIRAFMARAGELGVDRALTFLREVDAINLGMRKHAVNLAKQALGGSLAGKTIAILGAAFKPDSDDLRDSPAMAVAVRCANNGAQVRITDPAATDRIRVQQPQLSVTNTWQEAVNGADLVMLLTEWSEYKTIQPQEMAVLVNSKNIIDGRNVLNPTDWTTAGWHYQGIGRN
jgi:UDPglucose 6-dehydrogenase